MDLSVHVSPIRGYAIGSAVIALALLSPVVAFLTVIAAEALIDLLLAAGASAIFVVAAGAIALVLSRKLRKASPALLTVASDRIVGTNVYRGPKLALTAFLRSLQRE